MKANTRKLEAVRDDVRQEFPIADIDRMPAEIDVGAHLRKVSEAYEDVFAQYLKAYTFHLRSPELVASLDERGRQAWGSAHIRMTQGPELDRTVNRSGLSYV